MRPISAGYVNWDALTVELSTGDSKCTFELAAATIGTAEPPVPLEIACVGPQFSVNTHANVDMTQFPNRLIIAPTVPIDMSGLPRTLAMTSLKYS